jgi:hypothetical protein
MRQVKPGEESVNRRTDPLALSQVVAGFSPVVGRSERRYSHDGLSGYSRVD